MTQKDTVLWHFITVSMQIYPFYFFPCKLVLNFSPQQPFTSSPLIYHSAQYKPPRWDEGNGNTGNLDKNEYTLLLSCKYKQTLYCFKIICFKVEEKIEDE